MTPDSIPWVFDFLGRHIEILISVLFSVATFIAGLYLQPRFMPSRKPRCLFVDFVLLTQSHPDIEIQFQGSMITNLRVIRLVFWNAGKLEIRAEDRPEVGAPFVRLSQKMQLLSFHTKPSNSSTRATLRKTEGLGRLRNTIAIDFDFLNPGDGFRAEIYYTRSANSPDEAVDSLFFVGGTIKGASSVDVQRWVSWDPFVRGTR